MQIWKFQEEKAKFDSVRISPVSLAHLKQTNFALNKSETYLVLLIAKAGASGKSHES